MSNTKSDPGVLPQISIDPSDLKQDLTEACRLARPLRSTWENEWLAVFSCGVNGDIFRPQGVGSPQDKKIDEDLRSRSALFQEISRRLQTVRPSGGRIYLKKDGAYTWNSEKEEVTRFLRFPSELQLPSQERRRSESSTVQDDQAPPDQHGANRSSHDETGESTEEGGERAARKAFVQRIKKIPGVGLKKARALWRRGYRSKASLESASTNELAQVPWLGITTAKRIKQKLNSTSDLSSASSGHRRMKRRRGSKNQTKNNRENRDKQDLVDEYKARRRIPGWED